MAISSPWAMLITPISPNTMASPRAIRSRIDESDRPWNAISMPWVNRPQRSMRLIASRAAAASGAGAWASEASW